MTLRTTPEAEAALADLARAQGISKNEAVLRAIIRDRERIQLDADVETAYQEVSTEYREALDRLGSV